MKTLRIPIAILVLCALTGLAGCQTGYQSTRVALVTVDAAMQAWADYVHSGKAAPDQVQRVHVAYDRYWAAVVAARQAALAYKMAGDTNQTASGSVQEQMQKSLTAVLAAEPELIRLILLCLPTEKSAQLKGLL